MTRALTAAVAATTRAPRNWQALVDGMSDVQRLVHLALRRTADDAQEWRDRLFRDSRREYEETLRQEVISLGCGDPGQVRLQGGPELKRIADRAEFSGGSIVNTYNYDLARAIVQIGQDVPTANRYVYARRLEGWHQVREARKNLEISSTETSWSVNQAKKDFHRHNKLPLEGAEVTPYDTVCPECQEYVAGNPYESMEELYRQCTLPAHPMCPHHGRAILGERLSRDECEDLWIGE